MTTQPPQPDGEHEFLVTWKIDETAATPEEAARQALDTQRNLESIATVFEVTNVATGVTVTVDLNEPSHGDEDD